MCEEKIIEALKYEHELVIKITTESLYSFPYAMTRGFTHTEFLEYVKKNLMGDLYFQIGNSGTITKMEIMRG